MYKQNARRVRAFAHGRSRRRYELSRKCKERIKFVEPSKSHYTPSSPHCHAIARVRDASLLSPSSCLLLYFSLFLSCSSLNEFYHLRGFISLDGWDRNVWNNGTKPSSLYNDGRTSNEVVSEGGRDEKGGARARGRETRR